jgi:RimJ/RimL family protein N-acetyltransferase
MNAIKIRYYTKDDFEKWRILFSDMREKQNQWDWEKENIESLTSERFEKKLKKHSEERKVGNCYYYCVEEIESGELVGICLFTKKTEVSAEIGFQLNNKFWGNGYGTIVVDELINQAVKNKIEELIALVNSENEISKNILMKLDFVECEKNGKGQLILKKLISSL